MRTARRRVQDVAFGSLGCFALREDLVAAAAADADAALVGVHVAAAAAAGDSRRDVGADVREM